MLTSGPVVVMQVPENLDAGEVNAFMGELGPLLESNRPRIVLDCSQVRSIDSAGVEALLQCLEETLKRDGDLKLAALDRKSTRLNSSHRCISYAVFCLKKKNIELSIEELPIG